MAHRVKELAQPDEVLVSRSFHELLVQLSPHTADLFQYHGPTEQRPLEVYSVGAASSTGDEARPFTPTDPAPLSAGHALDLAAVQDIEGELAGYIGPLAHVLVRKAAARAATPQELRAMLAPAIHNPQTRDFFRIGELGQLTLRTVAIEPPMPQAAPVGRPLHRPDATRQVDVAPAELAIIEHTLTRFIGPVALPLMRREIDYYVRFRDFVDALAAGIEHPQQREVFLQALQRALPERRI